MYFILEFYSMLGLIWFSCLLNLCPMQEFIYVDLFTVSES